MVRHIPKVASQYLEFVSEKYDCNNMCNNNITIIVIICDGRTTQSAINVGPIEVTYGVPISAL